MSAPDLTAQRFWDGFDAARAEARAKAQTPLAAAIAAAALEHATVDRPTEPPAPESATLH
jgi:hypothetical protein